jgi:hypothetical protein
MKKKKETIKEKREREAADQKKRYQEKTEAERKAAAEKVESERKAAAEKTKAKCNEVARAAAAKRKRETGDKSAAKIAGLKSTFIIGDNELLMTSFGRGNKAVPEKRVTQDEITSLNEPMKFDASRFEEKKFEILSERTISYIDDPTHRGENDLYRQFGLKEKLEKNFFGQTFSDTIHVQLIYNILDIEKILAVFSNNIIYELDNLARSGNEEKDDFVGYMNIRESYEEFDRHTFEAAGDDRREKQKAKLRKSFKSYVDPENPEKIFERLKYFSSAFCIYRAYIDEKNRKRQTLVLRPEEEIYYILCMLGEVRQYTAHYNSHIYSIYTLEKNLNERAQNILSELYTRRIDELNNGFISSKKTSSVKNLLILFDVMGAKTLDEKKKLTGEFYDHVVRKQYKNRGFSIKMLRERLLDLPDATEIKDKKYDTMRSKLYLLLDFIISSYYRNCPRLADEIVSSLRCTHNDGEKADIYERRAKELWKNISNVVKELLKKMNGNVIKDIEMNEEVRLELEQYLKNEKILIGTDTNYFCKLIYLMTLFLDGKEINELLTTLINKFENIASLSDVMDEQGLPYNYKDTYKMFENSGKIAGDLRIINSFARMTKPAEDAKRFMFVEAAEILGTHESEAELLEYFDELLAPERGPRKPNGKKDNGFRNFIANNVVESTRFRYLIRYANPRKIRELANNKSVILFVLGEIPDPQIERYYYSCIGNELISYDKKRQKLSELITGICFRDFENVKQSIQDATKEELTDKERKKAVISLYLTILYLLTKNLVYVNSRYFMAFHCLERDCFFILKRSPGMPEKGKTYEPDGPKTGGLCEYKRLTTLYISACKTAEEAAYKNLTQPKPSQSHKHFRKMRVYNYMEANLKNAGEMAIHRYRNNVAHLSAIRNADKIMGGVRHFSSYFELYHYLMQSKLGRDPEILDENTSKYLNMVNTTGGYCKDLVKALNAPFGYNLPRFKNLSINELFDMNRPPEENKGESE